jgi:TM2 domain-containing membrane protein YozV
MLFIVLWFMFSVAVIQKHCHWIILKTFKSKILNSSGSKASKPLNNSAYYLFLALFTIYVMHEIMNSGMFSFCINSLVVGLHMCSILLLSPAVIVLLLSSLYCSKLSYDGLWSSIQRDVS